MWSVGGGRSAAAWDMENCLQCPDDQWPNEKRNKCIMRSIDFLSYKEPLGLALAIAAIVLSIFTAFILCIFIKYRDSPIVKANNQELSYAVLVSLMLSPLCILLFIGRPMKVTCLLRQVAFGIIFAISISSVLGKTITVVVAFNAIKPGSRLKKWIGSKVPRYIVLLCSLGEIIICSVWLLYSPPYPDCDTKTQPSVMILKCNEGFTPAFYVVIGYNALLASVCFVVAYFARKLPVMYNEAQHITFSMLVFCSVWISFIPSYLSTKGKYMVAVEIFAILASNSGLLGCIFISKCFIIFFRPELNSKRKIFN
ncbi:vomeronasal type-2 receptor 26-like [Pseudophryne corroboree]|uniref:vomeronasal type-2 receptor 26-like n=1 Tax=Pseudophryne corroboree TaxID=495146 RepID=UPI0030812F37